jgi:hypothetical protein
MLAACIKAQTSRLINAAIVIEADVANDVRIAIEVASVRRHHKISVVRSQVDCCVFRGIKTDDSSEASGSSGLGLQLPSGVPSQLCAERETNDVKVLQVVTGENHSDQTAGDTITHAVEILKRLNRKMNSKVSDKSKTNLPDEYSQQC